MGTKVRVHSFFLDLTEGEKVIETEGTTVGECLEFLKLRFPSTSKLFNKVDQAGLVVVCLNDLIIYPDEFDRLVAEDDEITIGAIVAGG